MGSLHNIDFGVCWASWGGSGKKKRVPGHLRLFFLGNLLYLDIGRSWHCRFHNPKAAAAQKGLFRGHIGTLVTQ